LFAPPLRIGGRGKQVYGATFASKLRETNIMKSLNRFHKWIMTGAALLALATITATAADKKVDKKPAPIPDKMTTCPVSGDKLGEMGKPYVFEYKGREVKLCCPDCKKDFEKDPDK
jgi:YHS domain-containing protein